MSTIILAFAWNTSSSQEILSPRIANYNMDITLDVETKKLHGQTQLTWTNSSDDTIDYLLFHLYYNAFRNSESTFMKERGVPAFLTSNIDKECGWGWSEISAITDEAGNSLLDSLSYIHPDDDNVADKTVLKIPLKQSAGPHETLRINFAWTAKIPKTMPRTGYNMDYYFLAQWFPKVGVYEPVGMRYAKQGGWNCHQYHSNGEYYADFGVYKVDLTVPKDYIVAASGQLVGQAKNEDMRTWSFIAEDVIDFTWTTSPHYTLVEDRYKETELKIYSYPEKKHFSERYLSTIKYCLAYLEEHLGPYPYSTLSIVDPPIHGLFTGGMEYPTLITALSFNSFPAGFKTPETLVAHEFIHQYFMQMVASHEVEDPWMDEGFTTYYEGRILDAYMSAKTSTIEWLGLNAGNKEWNRAEFFGNADKQASPNTVKSWQFKQDSYGPISYNKTALWLQTLEGLLGTATIDEIMKSYFQKWQFKHPCREDFIQVVNEVTIQKHADRFPKGMDWYFEQVLYGTDLCDYAVTELVFHKPTSKRGFLSSTELCEVNDPFEDDYRSEVTVSRLEGITLPIDLVVHFKNGSQETLIWNGQDRSKTFVFAGKEVIAAELDPDRKIYLDKNFINNSLTTEIKAGGTRALFARLMTSVQHVFETLSLFI